MKKLYDNMRWSVLPISGFEVCIGIISLHIRVDKIIMTEDHVDKLVYGRV